MSEFQNTGKIEKRLDGTTWYDQDYVDNLEQENKELKEKLEKAIEKVKDICFRFTTDKCWYTVVFSVTEDGRELLEILGDKECLLE